MCKLSPIISTKMEVTSIRLEEIKGKIEKDSRRRWIPSVNSTGIVQLCG
jgi:hypothetical protein